MEKVQNVQAEFARLREKRVTQYSHTLKKQNELLTKKRDELHQANIKQQVALATLENEHKLQINNLVHEHKATWLN